MICPIYNVGISFLAVYKLIAKRRFSILHKLRKADAVSSETAVTPEEADLNLEELQWLMYLAGAFSEIGKTVDGRYYARYQASS